MGSKTTTTNSTMNSDTTEQLEECRPTSDSSDDGDINEKSSSFADDYQDYEEAMPMSDLRLTDGPPPSSRRSRSRSLGNDHDNDNDSDDDDDDGFSVGSDNDTPSNSSGLMSKEEQERLTQQKQDQEYRKSLALKETKAIRRLKFCLVLLLLCVAGVIGGVVYKYTTDVQQTEFEDEFLEQGNKLVSGFYDDSFQKMQALESLSSALTYYALRSGGEEEGNEEEAFATDIMNQELMNNLLEEQDLNNNSTTNATTFPPTFSPTSSPTQGTTIPRPNTGSWPFIHIERSHEFFQPFLSLANAASIKLLPIVQSRERLAWEEFVATHQDWVADDLAKQQRLQQQQQGLQATTTTTTIDEDDNNNNNNNNTTDLMMLNLNDIENKRISPWIKNYVGVDTSPKQWMPWWHYAPVIPNNWFLNFNQLADAEFRRDAKTLLQNGGHAIIAKAQTYLPGLDFQSTRDLTFTRELLAAGGYGQYQEGEPIGFIHYPVFRYPKGDKNTAAVDTDTNENEDENDIVAVITATVYWKTFFQDILPETVKGIVCVVENDVQTFTYEIDGTQATFMGMEDLHDPVYDELEISAEYKAFADDDVATKGNAGRRYTGVPVDESRLSYKIRVYPSKVLEEPFTTKEPIWYAAVVACVMLLAILVFVIYDCYVERRQRKVSNVAVKSNAIVSSLFPASVKDKLLRSAHKDDSKNNNNNNTFKSAFKNPNAMMMMQGSSSHHRRGSLGTGSGAFSDNNKNNNNGKNMSPQNSASANNKDRNFMDYDDEDLNPHYGDSDPIADFFPSATVLFMDIAGFTAWSSSREPSQVFVLLETIYRSFDKIATRRRVFKVETIGDCYVAVCGLPEPCANHAPVMAMFARDCMEKMNVLAHRLEPKLGPDTGDLTVRIGMHSGPVTAGVLRGERARFQLFGDTVNTASRMESTGKPGFIQVSPECAELISAGGKSKLLRKRPDMVQAKGKGELQTYWLAPRASKTISTSSSPSIANGGLSAGSEKGGDAIEYMQNHSSQQDVTEKSDELVDVSEKAMKLQRLVDFNYDLLLNMLKKIMAKHQAEDDGLSGSRHRVRIPIEGGLSRPGVSCLDEVAEVIKLPKFDKVDHHQYDDVDVDVPLEVKSQLRGYCEEIARMYHDNAFHNFEHASHVTQSSSKLLSRIVAVQEIGNMEQAHDKTFGITSDPLTQFAVILSAMIHDVDHRGVPNNILTKEEPEMGEMYQNHAVAEQNSVEIAWDLLMEPNFSELRCAIYHGHSEMQRFRQLVVNCLMATDIFDAKLKAIREQRWKNAFHPEENTTTNNKTKSKGKKQQKEEEETSVNRKATIVIEHIIQASDVSHTMQHWHVYNKWNEKLFCEMYEAYRKGRSKDDPSKGWYKGELWFFDNYVIPLAQKLEECGVFGVSSDEYLIYARANRQEWERKGESIIKSNLQKIQQKLEQKQNQNHDSVTDQFLAGQSDDDDSILLQ